MTACSPWLRGTCSRRLNNNTAGTFSVHVNKQPALREGKGLLNFTLTQLQASFLAPASLSGRDWQTSHLTFTHKNSYRPHICWLKNTSMAQLPFLIPGHHRRCTFLPILSLRAGQSSDDSCLQTTVTYV